MKNSLRTLLKALVTLGLIYWLFTKLEDPSKLWHQFVNANKGMLLIATICYTGAVATGAVKWGILLRSAGIELSLPQLLRYQWMAEFFNNFLPGAVGGDVVRGVSLASDTKRRADALTSVLIDRFIGLMVFTLAATFASISVLIWGHPNGTSFVGDQRLYMSVIAVGSALVTLALLTLIAVLLSRRLKEWLDTVLLRLPLLRRLSPHWQRLAVSLNVHRSSSGALIRSAFGSLIIVLLTSATLWLVAEAIQPGSVSFLEMLVVNPMIVFALIAPLSPGGLGVRQVSLAYLFLLIGSSYDLGAAVGVVQQLLTYLVSIPGGVLWLLGRQKPDL
ncbi:MAG: lysylphosphatidylglycerol synthase transmembrane domain-containing protein [Caldilineaceae bacterium]